MEKDERHVLLKVEVKGEELDTKCKANHADTFDFLAAFSCLCGAMLEVPGVTVDALVTAVIATTAMEMEEDA